MSKSSVRIAAATAIVTLVVGLVSAVSAAPVPGGACKVEGRARVTRAGSLRCVRQGRVLRWVATTTTSTTTTTTTTTSTTAPSTTTTSTTTTTTTTVAAVRAPQVAAISADDSRLRFTISGMSPDTGNYAVQWVDKGRSFNTYRMLRFAERTIAISTAEFACGSNTYTFRVFVMRERWQLADGHQTQNVTPHSEPFDITTVHACPAPATTTTTTVPLSCAAGGVCAVGDTGPGGGIVFYVHSSGTFSCGRARTSTCKYLEYAPTSGASAWTDVAPAWSGNTTSAVGSEAQRTDIGTGYSNTLAIINDNSTADRAATATRAFRGPNNQSDWHLPSRLELNELCKYARQQTTGDSSVNCANTGTLRSGFQTGAHWSSTEVDATQARIQGFTTGTQSQTTKSTLLWVRPIRAFGGTLACADGGTCAVGDTGPGGGIVFYVASSNFTSTGSDCGTTCRYLEAAPAASEAGRSWATGANQTASVTGADATGIGSGYQNTVDINAQAGNVAATSAAVYAFDYTNNGKTDWHLASREELNELCKYARQQTTGDTSVACANTDSLRAGFAGFYWSSSEGAADLATIRDFDTGQIVANNKSFDRKARPIRAVASPSS